ncbi:MAG: hypothetical protein Q8K82_06130 [Gemmatimonadaceae bacterium]|nr:hypothetical protein [Gemmatimonadaceae bacterium]
MRKILPNYWVFDVLVVVNFGNSLTVTRAATLNAPTASGGLAGSNPRVTWPTVAGASRYHLYSSTGGEFT